MVNTCPCNPPGREAERAANRRLVHVYQLDVQARVACVKGIIIAAHYKFFRVRKLAENIRSRSIEFDFFRHDHVSQLNVEAKIADYAKG